MLSQWPPGFFDEWDRSLDELLDTLAPSTHHSKGDVSAPAHVLQRISPQQGAMVLLKQRDGLLSGQRLAGLRC